MDPGVPALWRRKDQLPVCQHVQGAGRCPKLLMDPMNSLLLCLSSFDKLGLTRNRAPGCNIYLKEIYINTQKYI